MDARSERVDEAADTIKKQARTIATLRKQMELCGPSPDAWQLLQDACGCWSDRLFGQGRTPSGCIAHLREEVEEVAAEPYDLTEYADCLLLLFDALRLAGWDTHELLKAAHNKLSINRARVWGEPDENGVARHVKPESENNPSGT